MAQSLHVTYIPNTNDNTGEITLLSMNGQQIKKFETNKLYAFVDSGNTMTLNDNDRQLIRQNEYLRLLDMEKDSGVKPGIGLDTFKQIFQNDGRRSIVNQMKNTQALLSQYETNAEKYFTRFSQIKKYSWIKDKHTLLSGENRFSFDYGFYESGLDFNSFANVSNLMQNFGNRIVDNAGRPKNMVESLPYITTIDESVFGFFGLYGCNVAYTYSSSNARKDPYPSYSMDIMYPGKLTSPPNPSEQMQISIGKTNSSEWFLGNNKKNKEINKRFASLTPNSLAESYYLLHTKEMGDFLQVLYMFIWYILNVTDVTTSIPKYAMTTGDKVVWLTCMMLSLNSFLSFVEKNNKNVKMRCIQYFVGKEYTKDDAIANFESEKRKILKDNDAFLKTIRYLKDNPSTPILVQGVENVFPMRFYEEIEEDVNIIIGQLTNYDIVASAYTVSEIDGITQDMKYNFTIIYFIQGIHRRFKILHSAKKYTARNNLWITDPDPNNNLYAKYERQTFYQRGLLLSTQQGGSKIYKKPRMMTKRNKRFIKYSKKR